MGQEQVVHPTSRAQKDHAARGRRAGEVEGGAGVGGVATAAAGVRRVGFG